MVQDHDPRNHPANGYPARPLRDVCLSLSAKVNAFLAEHPESQLLRDVQAQLRVSLKVIEEALQKYRYARAHTSSPCALTTY
jgi:FAD synthetase